MRLGKGLSVLNKYFTLLESSSYYLAALVLNPSRRAKYICTFWPEKLQASALRRVKDLWIKYRDNSRRPTTSFEILSSTDTSKQKDPNLFEQASHSLTCETNEDEYENYVNGDPTEIGKQSPLEWWFEDIRQKQWPRLSHMAIDILSMPAMSDEPERIFSGARRTISWERSQLQPSSIEYRECLKHWKRNCLK